MSKSARMMALSAADRIFIHARTIISIRIKSVKTSPSISPPTVKIIVSLDQMFIYGCNILSTHPCQCQKFDPQTKQSTKHHPSREACGEILVD